MHSLATQSHSMNTLVLMHQTYNWEQQHHSKINPLCLSWQKIDNCTQKSYTTMEREHQVVVMTLSMAFTNYDFFWDPKSLCITTIRTLPLMILLSNGPSIGDSSLISLIVKSKNSVPWENIVVAKRLTQTKLAKAKWNCVLHRVLHRADYCGLYCGPDCLSL